MSLISFDRLLSIIETVCEILLTAISKLKSPNEELKSPKADEPEGFTRV